MIMCNNSDNDFNSVSGHIEAWRAEPEKAASVFSLKEDYTTPSFEAFWHHWMSLLHCAICRYVSAQNSYLIHGPSHN